MKLAKDKLLVYGLSEKEIENAKSRTASEGEDDPAVACRWGSGRAAGRHGELLYICGPIDENRAS